MLNKFFFRMISSSSTVVITVEAIQQVCQPVSNWWYLDLKQSFKRKYSKYDKNIYNKNLSQKQ